MTAQQARDRTEDGMRYKETNTRKIIEDTEKLIQKACDKGEYKLPVKIELPPNVSKYFRLLGYEINLDNWVDIRSSIGEYSISW